MHWTRYSVNLAECKYQFFHLVNNPLSERITPEEKAVAGAWPDQLKLKKLDDDLLGDEDDYDDEDYYDEDYDEDEEDDKLYDDEGYYKDDYKEDEKVGVMKQLDEFTV